MRLLHAHGAPLLPIVSAAAAGIALAATGTARAQAVDENPPLPNVLLLLDTSGSMERMIDGTFPEQNSTGNSTCSPGVQSLPNRWGVAMQALTGDVQPYYSCVAQSRTSGFNEYNIAGQQPYDANYFMPYHRPVSWVAPTSSSSLAACVYAPGGLPGAGPGSGVGPTGTGLNGNATDFPSNAIVQRVYGTTNTSNTCAFNQAQDGAITTSSSTMRFGLMTFDSDTSAATGQAAGNLVNTAAPFTGMWSYFPSWNGTGTGGPASGNLPGCITIPFEVGARNPAAPPWEGRFLMFPSPTATTAAVQSANQQVATAINAMRPYGPTPTAGLFSDANYYFTADPAGPYKSDPYVQGGCRSQYIILLTDGAPNLDLRPNCYPPTGTPASKCPYDLPENYALNLANGLTGQKVTTFVIGFAVSQFDDGSTLVKCSNLAVGGSQAGICATSPVPPLYQPCCNLQKIAYNGGTGSAYFADTPGALSQALSAILAQISNQTTTRTIPAYSPAIANPSNNPNQPTPQNATFLASFAPNIGKPWSGDIQREQQQCTLQNGKFTTPNAVVTFSNGDDFAANVNSHAPGGFTRSYFAVQPGLTGQAVDSTTTIRPFVSTTPLDNLGNYGGTQWGPSLSAILSNLTPSALNIQTQQAQCANVQNNQWLTTTNCMTLAFNFAFGNVSTPGLQTNPAPPTPPLTQDANGFMPFYSRYCYTSDPTCQTATPSVSAMGDIFHATPTVVAAPSALLQDESYEGFALNNENRKTIVYAPTNDGILHAFWANPTAMSNNELFALVPPGANNGLITQYPATHQFLLDGAPVVKDVVFNRSAGPPGSSIAVDPTVWHTMLVASYGSQARGFYAVDVSAPDPTTIPAGKPTFQWQLTTFGSPSNNIFGLHSATPAITTVYANPDGNGVREIGVAILPGGEDSGPTSGGSLGGPSCARSGPVTGLNTATPAPSSGSPYTARSAVRCWGPNQLASDPVVGRSLAVVRLDTGEIIQLFTRKGDLPATHPIRSARQPILNELTTYLDSPMTGTPIVYPADVGAVAQKAFISDADGTIWKLNLTSTTPSQWTLQIFLDTFNKTVDTAATSWQDGQPIEVPPVVSLDTSGNVVLGVATGDLETYTPVGTNYVYSISETVQGTPATLRAQVNWYMPLTLGARVSGPMAVFNNTLYLATFAPSTTTSCTAGAPTIWGMDYINMMPPGLDPSLGGAPKLTGAGGNLVQWVDPTVANPTIAGKVIPGVSITSSPACADLSGTATDQYVYGAQHTTASNVTSGVYSLFFQAGGKATGTNSSNTAALTGSIALTQPTTLTTVESWAAVVE